MGEVPQQIYAAFQRMKEKDYSAAEEVLQKGLQGSQDPATQALFHSTLGVLAKVKGEFQQAWRCYERAEKLLPEDPSLKIITAKFLIEQFAQYDTAIKKLKKVLKLAKGSPSYEHQAHAILAIAYLKKGERKKAVEMLTAAMANDFQPIITAQNVNLEVIEAFLARNFELDLCRSYLTRALALARTRQEQKSTQLFTKLLESFV